MTQHTGSSNIASYLPKMAALQPHTPAIYFPEGRGDNGKVRYTHYTYAQLDRASDVYAAGLERIGISRGTRTVLMVKPSLEFFALTFAIFKVGAVPVLVDPGIGIDALGTCLAEAEPGAFIGIPPAHAARITLGWARKSIKKLVTVGKRWFWGGYTLEKVRKKGLKNQPYEMADTSPDEVAAILFTSGSTGIPKGAVYRHGNFMAQVEAIRKMYDIQPGEIDLPTFPLFALFDPALGMTTVVPDMDFTKPAEVDPAKIVEAVVDFGVTNMFGSPALLNTVARFGESTGAKLPTIRRVISAGAPVPSGVMESFLRMLPEGAEINTPYGATESLPVATISSSEVLGDTRFSTDQGAGVCVGRPVDSIDLKVIRISDEEIPQWDDSLVLPQGEVGEIVVKGPQVTRAYYNRPKKTLLAKISDPDGSVRHRMGDVGYLDEGGRVWFCGRKAHRVVLAGRTLFSVQVEAIFNTHPDVFRSALVGVERDGQTVPALCVEVEKGARRRARRKIARELFKIGRQHDHTAEIHHIFFHPAFPVDIRHNAKIGREKLADWASQNWRKAHRGKE